MPFGPHPSWVGCIMNTRSRLPSRDRIFADDNAFDYFEKAFWMTRDPPLKAAVDAVPKKSLEAGDYQRALAAPAGKS